MEEVRPFKKRGRILPVRLSKKIPSISQCVVRQTTESITDNIKRKRIITGGNRAHKISGRFENISSKRNFQGAVSRKTLAKQLEQGPPANRKHPSKGMSFQPPYPGTSWLCPTWLDPHVCSPTPSSLPPSQSHTCVFKDQMQVRGTLHWEGMWLVSVPAFRGKMSGEDMLERVRLKWGRQQDLHIDLCYSWSPGSKAKASLQGYVLVTKSCARSWEMAIQILS